MLLGHGPKLLWGQHQLGAVGNVTVSMWDLYLGSVEFALQAWSMDMELYSSKYQERLLANILMLFGSMVYGYAIGEICDKTSALNPAQQLCQQNMDLPTLS